MEGKSHSVIKCGRFEAVGRPQKNGNVLVFRLKENGRDLLYGDVLRLWEKDQGFLDFYLSVFAKCGFDSYRWETPPVSTDTLTQVFEFVLLNTPTWFKQPDRDTFAEYYDPGNADHGVVSFPNLGYDAVLVVPSPLTSDANYSGLAEFFRESPIEQQRSIWKVTAQQVKLVLSEKPTWVSVAGGGIAWLHVRLDRSPKYYGYTPYTDLSRWRKYENFRGV